jgi:hypothetical protein
LRHVASRLTASATLQLFEQVANLSLGVLSSLMATRTLDLKR